MAARHRSINNVHDAAEVQSPNTYSSSEEGTSNSNTSQDNRNTGAASIPIALAGAAPMGDFVEGLTSNSSNSQDSRDTGAAPMGDSVSFSAVTSPTQTPTSADSTSRKRPRIEGNVGCVFGDCEPDMWEYRFQRRRPPNSHLKRTWDGHAEFRKQLQDLVDADVQRSLRLEVVEPNHLTRFSLWGWGLNMAYATEGQEIPQGKYSEAQRLAIETGKGFRDETRLLQRRLQT
ncbi:hypothetical protein SpCBS45565_g07488 [Spizellomyces sp. 'palustris']|nr:hypothetical protein SpCBS45565_g07488 [Spizellomyces sp. 'palustris']